jgi:arylsulfate sulfotransferase
MTTPCTQPRPAAWAESRCGRVFGWALALALGLVGCGGGNDDAPHGPRLVNPAVSALLSSVDALGTGGADLLSNNPARADLALQSNLAGGTVQLRFSCAGCDISVASAGATVSANQYLPIPFATLDSASDATVLVTDKRSGAQATYTLHARPADHAPYTVRSVSNPESGDLYITPFDPQGFAASYAYIVGNDGSLKYYFRNPRGAEIHDFKKTVIPGGATRYSFYDGAASAVRVMDGNFKLLANVSALPFPDGNTYAVNLHDHVILDDGHYILGVQATKTVNNIPALPGQALFVGGSGLQEIQNGVAVFSWLSTDHPELYACSTEGNDYAQNNGADYAHWDSVAVDADGQWLASFRHLDAVLKINRSTGAIAWILGGPCDQFGLSASQKFSHQHHARRAPDGRLTLFDNNTAGGLSRALAFNLDEAGKTLVSSNPALPGFAQFTTDTRSSVNLGSAQFFADGKLLVGWGAFPGGLSDVSEFDGAAGTPSFRLTLQPSAYSNGYFSYRAQKFP